MEASTFGPVSNIRNPRWADVNKTMILVDCDIEDLGMQGAQFGAHPEDVHEHGRLIHAQAVRGKFGPVAAFVPAPVDKAQAAMDAIAELERTVTPRRLRESALGTDNGWLLAVEKRLNEMRRKLPKG